MGAAPHGLGQGHRRVDAERPRLVARGGHDAPTARIAADDDGLATQLGAVALLDRGEERVEIDVEDGSTGRRGHGGSDSSSRGQAIGHVGARRR